MTSKLNARTTVLLALASGLTGGFAMESEITYTTRNHEPDNRGRRAEKDAAKLAKAEKKRQLRAAKRDAANA